MPCYDEAPLVMRADVASSASSSELSVASATAIGSATAAERHEPKVQFSQHYFLAEETGARQLCFEGRCT
jgi:hypothetical protein